MIKGNKVTIKLFETEQEVIEHSKLYNDISERAITDHTEVHPVFSRLDTFKESNFWDDKKGKMMILNEDGIMIGTIGYSRMSEYELNIGYRLLKSEFRGKGYMTEALNLFTSYLFDVKPGLERISLYTASNNIPSQKLAEKCGYTFEGILRNAYFYRGEMYNFHVYSMLKNEKK